jgi:hypothetical protein
LTAYAVVLAAAMLLLVLAPFSVSREVVLTEVLVLSAAFVVMLAANLILLGRTLAPVLDRLEKERRPERRTGHRRGGRAATDGP